MKNCSNGLTIDQSGKGIPYGGTGEPREDGHANHGFKNLKGEPGKLDEIPELKEDGALRDLIKAINEPETGLFSVGCLSAPVDDGRGHRVTGYVEFAINSDILAADARHYFPIFFHFDKALSESSLENVNFHWELMGANFHEANVVGFTLSVTINTGYFETADKARTAWDEALALLTQYLSGFGPGPGQPIY